MCKLYQLLRQRYVYYLGFYNFFLLTFYFITQNVNAFITPVKDSDDKDATASVPSQKDHVDAGVESKEVDDTADADESKVIIMFKNINFF